MAASARVEKVLLFAASKLGYETLKEEQKKAFVAGNDVFVVHDGHNPASVQQSPLMVIRICNSTDSASVLGAAGHLNSAALALTLLSMVSYLAANTTTRARCTLCGVILRLRLRKLNH